MVASLLKLAGLNWAVPDYTTLCRRQKTLAVQIPYRRADGPLNLLVDSTGIKFLGDGEWQAVANRCPATVCQQTVRGGARYILPWIMTLRTSGRWNSPPEAMVTAPCCQNCSIRFPKANRSAQRRRTADGAYDTRRCHTAIIDRQATPIIPIRKNGRPWKEDCPAAIARNETLRATRHYGRAFWKRWTRYHTRSRIEAKMRCLKAFGERIAARHPDSQTAEIQIRVALINRFNALGTAEIVRVA
jgi:hypothetical protein